jgi:hypothetical protein
MTKNISYSLLFQPSLSKNKQKDNVILFKKCNFDVLNVYNYTDI